MEFAFSGIAMLARFHLQFSLALLMLMLLFGGGCASSMTTQEEIQLGQQSRQKFEQQFGGLYPDQDVQQYVQQVGSQLAREADRPQLPWEYRVVNSDQINAFALPGGFIYITRGLLSHLNDEAQLAFILGHETAHVAHRDSVQQLEQQQLIGGAVGLAGVLGSNSNVPAGDIGQLVGGLALMKYSRGQEQSADLTGLKYIADQGYNLDAAVQSMQILQNLSGPNGPPEFLSSHPSDVNRIDYLKSQIQKDYGNVISSGKIGKQAFEQHVLRRMR